MKINWKVRFKNPVFWAQIAIAVFVPVLAYFGLQWEDMTTWAAIGRLFLDAVKNPVVVLSVVVSVFNAINDPTSTGITDSAHVLCYDLPNADKGDAKRESVH